MVGSLAAAAAVLLVVSGPAKVWHPSGAAVLLAAGWPGMRRISRGQRQALVRGGGVAETAVGLFVLVSGDRVSMVLLACSYAAFSVVTVRLTATGQRTSCGCFGRADSPIGIAHLVLSSAAALVAVAGAMRPVGPAGGLFGQGVALGLIGAGQVLLLCWLGFLAVTALPVLAALRRRVRP